MLYDAKAERKTILRLWVNALESGEYTQGTQMLHDGKRYCCLGVLAKVMGETFVINKDREWVLKVNGISYRDNLPEQMWEKLGLEAQIHYAMKNDCEGWSFGKIAQYIRQTHLQEETVDA